jgi:two-component system, LuxR family, sensor kinase FixL
VPTSGMQKTEPSGLLQPALPTVSDPRQRIWSLEEWELAIVFAGLYLVLERLSFIHPWAPTGITPWNPQIALALGLVLVRGLRALPALLLATLISEAMVRVAPAPLGVVVFGALILTCGYAAAGFGMSRGFSARGRIGSLRDFAWMLAIVSAAPLLIGTLYVALNVAYGVVTWTDFPEGLLRYWIGDVVGILALMPFFLVLSDRTGRRKLAAMLPRWETAVQFAAALAILACVFMFLPKGHVKFFFVLFLPLIWMAARHGLVGAAAGLAFIQVGLVVVVQASGAEAWALLELQARMLALSVTGLLLGVVVDERERAQESLRQSLRLAAAGEMAAALAHEVNQPLSALVTYGRACQHMLSRNPPDMVQLEQTVGKITEQAQRVGAIVKRLRDFLRSGTMNLERVAPEEFVSHVCSAFAAEAKAKGITLETRFEADLPRVLVDRLELEIVLRNLIANALDSIREARPAHREILVEAASHEGGFVRLGVVDSGPGIPESMRDRLFLPFSTSKSKGMGLGLAISRAIVKAHGGRLWVEPTNHGSFHLTLPTLTGETDDSDS